MKSMMLVWVFLASIGAAQAGAKFSLGSATSLFNAIQSRDAGAASTYTLFSTFGQSIPVRVEDSHQEANYLYMVGRADESPNSDFILKGNPADIYGWVVLKHRNIAYEYTTDGNGTVLVEEVPVTKIFPVCDLPEEDHDLGDAGHSHSLLAPQSAGPESHIGPYPGTAPNKFQSKPGAPKVLYWDISETPDLWTPAQMWEAWQTFASTMSMFDVNVTTDSAVWAATPAANRGRSHQVTGTGRSSCGLNSFGTSRACNIYKKSSPAYQGGTLGHEVGHQIGLSHDGTASASYFSGLSPFKWVPMMGSHASAIRYGVDALLQYSKGEYNSANQTQDDFNLITVTRRHLAFRAKTHNGIVPLRFGGASEVPALQNRGQIVKDTDKDVWSFRTTGGRANLKIERTERPYGSMLDVDATLRDASGTEVARSNPSGVRNAVLDVNLPAGSYALEVKGGAEGTPLNGFSNYSSRGFYAISGTIIGGSGIPTGIAAKGDWQNYIGVYQAGSRLEIRIPGTAKVAGIRLSSASGQIVFHSRMAVDAIDLSGLPAGIYVLSMEVDGLTRVRPILKSPH